MRLNEKRKQLEEEISIVKRQIATARRLGQQVDDLALRLAVLRSDLASLTITFRPGWIQRMNTLGGIQQ